MSETLLPPVHPAARPGHPGNWREGFVRWRNRVLSDPRFQTFAARFPLTRPIAQARAARLFAIATGFAHSRTLFAVVETGLLDLLAEGALPAGAIARAIDLPAPAALTLLKAAATLELVEDLGGAVFALGELGAAVRGNPGVPEMVRHHSLLYRDLLDPVALLRSGGGRGALAAFWPYATGSDDKDGAAVQDYSALMGRSQAMLAGYVVASIDFARFARVMDVGGGEGVFIEAVAAAAPRTALTLFDLPPVAARAQRRLSGLGLGARVACVGGSFLDAALPRGADCVTLNRVLHDHDDGPAMTMLRAIRAALPERGTLVISEPLAGTPGALEMGDGYFGLYLHAMGSGRPRTRQEISAMLREAGFASVRERRSPQPLLVRMLVART
jgi:demethylspheroidene O-methyltransferase